LEARWSPRSLRTLINPVRDTIPKSCLQRQLHHQYAELHTCTSTSQLERNHLKFYDLDSASCGILPAKAVSVMVVVEKIAIACVGLVPSAMFGNANSFMRRSRAHLGMSRHASAGNATP
ncbi:uncharacterized protein Bfra_007695, partial [Botrytis fragariae]